MSHLSAMELAEILARSVYKKPKKISEDERIRIEAENGYFDDAVSDPEVYKKYYGRVLNKE